MKKFKVFIITFFIGLNTCFAISVPSNNAILIDQDSGRILFSKNINEKHLIASTTKIMTAVLAIESGKLDDMVTINESILKSHGSGIYIKEGEKISLRNLVYGLLLRSGNDAALAIEDYLGGHDKFVNKMNEKAGEIGMKNTVFNITKATDLYPNCNNISITIGFNIILIKFSVLENVNFSYAVMIEPNILKGNVIIKLNVSIFISTFALAISSVLMLFPNNLSTLQTSIAPIIPAIIPIIT